jgi:hypothetical protein
LARSQPACRHGDSHAIAHADAQASDPNACARAANSDGGRIRHVDTYGDANGHSDCYTLDYPHSYADGDADTNSQATDQDALSDAHLLADACTGGRNGACE